MTPPEAPVTTATTARALAEVIRDATLAATDGRTYAELLPYVGPGGVPTDDPDAALVDEISGGPRKNPQQALWVQSTALQTALMQAYVGFRVAELTTAAGGAFLATGAGLAALARR